MEIPDGITTTELQEQIYRLEERISRLENEIDNLKNADQRIDRKIYDEVNYATSQIERRIDSIEKSPRY